MIVKEHPEGIIFYMRPESQSPEDRFLRFLLAEHDNRIAELIEEDYQAGPRTYSMVLIRDPLIDGMLDGMIEGAHSGEITELYRDELPIIGYKPSEIIAQMYSRKEDPNPQAEEMIQEATEKEYDKLSELSVELFFRSCCEIVLLRRRKV